MLRVFVLTILCFGFSGFSFVPPAFGQDDPVRQLTKSEKKAALAEAGTLGELIFFYDRAAWLATDAMLEDYGEAARDVIGGWVVTEYPEAKHRSDLRVAFINKAEPPQVIWEGRVRKNRLRQSGPLAAPRDLTAEEVSRRRAVNSAIADPALKPCKEFLPMNFTVFAKPGDPDGNLYVYMLSATNKVGEAVFGRHFRFETTADGGTVIGSRGYTNSCIAVPMAQNLPKGATPLALTISHILDPLPQETHVFVSLSNDMPVMVIMSERQEVYAVDGKKIRAVKSGL
jgi:hypothetical protein